MHILLLYIARTSSSYIWQLFKGFKEIHVYGEILNGPEKYLKALNASEKLGIPDETESYRELARKNLPKYLDFLEKESSAEHFFTKISLVHIYSLIKKKSPELREILHDPNVIVVVLERNLIDTYVSLKKVGITRAWRDKDTTDIKIEINYEDFLDYYQRMTMLYNNLYEILENKSYIKLNYDELHSSNMSDFEKAAYIRKKLEKLGHQLELNEEKLQKIRLMFQQDKNDKFRDKIIGFAEFRQFLVKNQLKHLLAPDE